MPQYNNNFVYCVQGKVKWNNKLISKLALASGKSEIGLRVSITQLAKDLGVELPRHPFLGHFSVLTPKNRWGVIND
jgi:hypothetical protein